jgi:hypothetical protein
LENSSQRWIVHEDIFAKKARYFREIARTTVGEADLSKQNLPVAIHPENSQDLVRIRVLYDVLHVRPQLF